MASWNNWTIPDHAVPQPIFGKGYLIPSEKEILRYKHVNVTLIGTNAHKVVRAVPRKYELNKT